MTIKKQYNSKKNNSNLFIYGKYPVIAALKNQSRKSENLYTTKKIWNEIKNLIPSSRVKVNLLEPDEISKMLPAGSNHQNILLEASQLKKMQIEDIIEQSSAKEYSCLVILDQITDPQNIGAIIRSASAFEIDAVILPDYNSPKENATILKCSAGAYENIPTIYVNNLVNCIKLLKTEGYWVIGLDGNTNTELSSSIFSNKTVIILGSEDTGMRQLTKTNCDYVAKIKISDSLESLNVSNAAAIAMYEFSKYTQPK